MTYTPAELDSFKQRVWEFYRENKRQMPWREKHDLYSVLVSEIMLQQTQVSRVMPKFLSFMKSFPSLQALAEAPLADVLIAWQGLGYNRRAKYLHACAQQIVLGGVPDTQKDLETLPGIGANTAGAVMAYVYNQPSVFVETNIRTVILHEFFRDDVAISDAAIRELVTETVDKDNPREWYWAMMDYGSYLKSQKLGSIKRSVHYKKQSTFKGSLRQMRGQIIKELLNGPVSRDILQQQYDDRFDDALLGLIKDGLVEQHESVICLTAHDQQS